MVENAEKVVLLVFFFFDIHIVVHHEFRSGQTMNVTFYVEVLKRLRNCVRLVRPNLYGCEEWLLNHRACIFISYFPRGCRDRPTHQMQFFFCFRNVKWSCEAALGRREDYKTWNDKAPEKSDFWKPLKDVFNNGRGDGTGVLLQRGSIMKGVRLVSNNFVKYLIGQTKCMYRLDHVNPLLSTQLVVWKK